MSDFNQLKDTLNVEQKDLEKLPSGINVLTILTYIWCGISALLAIWGFISAEKNYKTLEEAQNNGTMDNLPGFMKGMMGPEALEAARKSFEARLPMLIVGLVGIALCFYGAMQMRNFKKQGYYIWLIGEILPIIVMIIFVGTFYFKGFGAIGLLFPVVFIILYATQLKHLK